ncbi:MAG: hypothetical protein ACFFDT_23170 [Candidatus Hodarchaeota archaeon]
MKCRNQLAVVILVIFFLLNLCISIGAAVINNYSLPNNQCYFLYSRGIDNQIVSINQTYGGSELDYAYSIIPVSDGDYILAGYTYSYGDGQSDAWLVKINRLGQQEWSKTYGGVAKEAAQSVILSSDGGYIFVGLTESYGMGEEDMWLVKTDTGGQVEWNQTFGGTGQDIAFSVVVAPDGGYVLSGRTTSFGIGAMDVWVVKTDAAGQMEWNQTFGGVDDDDCMSILTVSDGGYVLIGSTKSFGMGGMDMWLVKIDAAGQVEWNQTFGGTGHDVAFSGIVTPDGGYVIVGNTNSFGAGNDDIWVIKTNAAGQIEWNQTYGGIEVEWGNSIIATADSGYVVAGRTGSYGDGAIDMWLVKINATGQAEWNQTFGGVDDDVAYSVMTTSDGGYILIGRTSSYGAGNVDLWLIKITLQNDSTKTTDTSDIDCIIISDPSYSTTTITADSPGLGIFFAFSGLLLFLKVKKRN